MRTPLMLTAGVLAALPGLALGQPVTGLYVGAGAGGNFMQPQKYESSYAIAPFRSYPAVGGADRFKLGFDVGAAGVASVGYGFGNGVRIEAEGDYRHNDQSSGFYLNSRRRAEQKFGAMGNVLFDFDIGSRSAFPYIGAGAGYMEADRSDADRRLGSFAYQGIAGVALPVPRLRGLSATLEYRFMGLASAKSTDVFAATASSPAARDTNKYYNDLNHSLMVGLRYAFNTAPPAAPPIADTAPPAMFVDRAFLVFFDWDRADLTARARQILAEAATFSTRQQTTRIEVQGNADRSGTPAYNLALSRRRAEVVGAELIKDGVAKSMISIVAFGDSRPLVPTGAGVREPQNRRVELVFR